MTKIVLACILIAAGVIICLKSQATEIPDSTVTITYMGATAYLIESANYKILIEPSYDDIVKGFNYPYSNSFIEDDLWNGKGKFDSIDLIIISHVHLGHFNVQRTLSCFEANEDALLITTDSVAKAIKNEATDYSSISDRIIVPELPLYEMLDTTILDIPFTITEVEHWGPTTLHQYTFDVDGIRIAFYLDQVKRDEQDYHVKTDSLDICIVDGKMFLDAAKREMLMEDFEIGLGLFTHFNTFNDMDQKLAELKDEFPNLGYLKESMEEIVISKQSDTISIDTLNNCPKVIAKSRIDTFEVGQAINAQFPELFEDADGDELEISVTLGDGSALPDWLYFDASNTTLTGTPPQAEKIYVLITATDPSNSWITYKYTVVVKAEPNLSGTINESVLRVYPTIVNKELMVDLGNSLENLCQYKIFTVKGMPVKEGEINTVRSKWLNVSSLPTGYYILTLTSTNIINQQPFIKQ